MTIGRLMLFWTLLLIGIGAQASTSSSDLLEMARPFVYEVVEAKPTHDNASYATPLPGDKIPLRERKDGFFSFGTAFALGGNRYVTAAHVLLNGIKSLRGEPELRGYNGRLYPIDKIYEFSLHKDFVVFSLVDKTVRRGLGINDFPKIGQKVYAIGDAHGAGISIRDGEYVSVSLEPRAGNMEWLRFTAPVFHGDSGSPLLDQNGNVIGIVVDKSITGAPNFAVPIRYLAEASKDRADIHIFTPYHFDLIEGSLTDLFQPTIQLPLPLTLFYEQFNSALHSFWKSQLDEVISKYRPDVSPRGWSSNSVPYGTAWTGHFPAFLTRSESGAWAPEVHQLVQQAVSKNWNLGLGRVGQNMLFYFERRRGTAYEIAALSPEATLNMLLTPGTIWRVVEGQRIKVVSLGKPSRVYLFTDTLRRRWCIWIWPISFSNSYIIVFALPIANGYVGFFRMLPSAKLYDFLINMKAMASFFILPSGQ